MDSDILWKQIKRRGKKLKCKEEAVDMSHLLLPCMKWSEVHYLAGLNTTEANEEIRNVITQIELDKDVLGRTPLWYAARAGNDDILPTFLANCSDAEVNEALCVALDWHRISTACLLLQIKPELEIGEATHSLLSSKLSLEGDRYSPILQVSRDQELQHQFMNHACWTGNKAVVRQALSSGVSVNESDHMGRTPLHNAVQQMHYDIIKDLLSSAPPGTSLSSGDAYGNTPLHYACALNTSTCRDQALAVVALLVTTCPSVLNQQNRSGRTPLMVAMYLNNQDLASHIVRNYLDLLDTSITDCHGYSYSHYNPLYADMFSAGTTDNTPPEPCSDQPKKETGPKLKYLKKVIMRFIKDRQRYRGVTLEMDEDWLVPFAFHDSLPGPDAPSVLHMCMLARQIDMLGFLATADNQRALDGLGRTPLALAVDLQDLEAVQCLLQHVILDPTTAADLITRCIRASDDELVSCPIIQTLLDNVDLEKHRDCLNASTTSPCLKYKYSKSKACPMTFLQYAFLHGTSSLIGDISDKVDVALLQEKSTECSCWLGKQLSPLELGALGCREALLTDRVINSLSCEMKCRLATLSCSLHTYRNEKGSCNYISGSFDVSDGDALKFTTLLFDSGCETDLESCDDYSRALQAACTSGFTDTACHLASLTAPRLLLTTKENRTPLEVALLNGHEDLFLTLKSTLDRDGVKVEVQLAWQLLTAACSRGEWEAASQLLADLESWDSLPSMTLPQDDRGNTCLHYLARQGKAELLHCSLRVLSTKGRTVELHVRNKSGRSPLCCAMLGNHWHCAFTIITFCSLTLPSHLLYANDCSAFYQSARHDPYKAMVERMLPLVQGLQPGISVFLRCCASGDLQLVQEQLAIRPDLLYMEDPKGRSALFYILINGHTDLLPLVEPESKPFPLLAMLINQSRKVLNKYFPEHRNSSFQFGDIDAEFREPEMRRIIGNICSDDLDIITINSRSLADDELDELIPLYWHSLQRQPDPLTTFLCQMLILFLCEERLISCLAQQPFDLDLNTWRSFKVKYSLEKIVGLIFPDPVLIMLSATKALTDDRRAFISEAINILSQQSVKCGATAQQILLVRQELDLLSEIYQKMKVVPNTAEVKAAFLQACADGHPNLATAALNNLDGDLKYLRLVGLNLAIFAKCQDIVAMLLASGTPAHVKVPEGICKEMQAELFLAKMRDPRRNKCHAFPYDRWRCRYKAGWNGLMSAAAVNSVALFHSLLDACELTDEMLTEAAMVAAAYGSTEVLHSILSRKPKVLHIDVASLELCHTWTELAGSSLLACSIKNRHDDCAVLIVRHMLQLDFVSHALVDVLYHSCELGLTKTVQALLSLSDRLVIAEEDIAHCKSSALENGHLQIYEELAALPCALPLSPDRSYDIGLAQFVREICALDNVSLPLAWPFVDVIEYLLLNSKETTVFQIFHRLEDLDLLKLLHVEDIVSLLMKAIQTLSFGVLGSMLALLDDLHQENMQGVTRDLIVLAIRKGHEETLRSILLHKGICPEDMPYVLHNAAIFGNAQVATVIREFVTVEDLSRNSPHCTDSTAHDTALACGNKLMAQALDPVALSLTSPTKDI